MEQPGSLNPKKRSRQAEVLFIIGFVGLNLCAPVVFGERFPFTISPMFCDEPSCYCEYEVRDAEGKPVELADLKMQRVYDGNPVGLGVGIEPPATLDQFGAVPTREEVTEHLLKQIEAWPETSFLSVELTVVGATDADHVGPVETDQFIVERP
jgi:hypothetical protein